MKVKMMMTRNTPSPHDPLSPVQNTKGKDIITNIVLNCGNRVLATIKESDTSLLAAPGKSGSVSRNNIIANITNIINNESNESSILFHLLYTLGVKFKIHFFRCAVASLLEVVSVRRSVGPSVGPSRVIFKGEKNAY